jgi:hypothetical protein
MNMVTKANASLAGGVGNPVITVAKIAGRNRTPMKAFTINMIWRIIPTRTRVRIVSSFDTGCVTSLSYYPPRTILINAKEQFKEFYTSIS